jgi:KUP system potassium uptake protein
VSVLALGALGVVFGDIGTSPLYALKTVFTADDHAVHATQADVYGVLSLVVWSLILVVSIKYLTVVLRADREGEGGIMALIGLVRETKLRHARIRMALIIVGLFGAALFLGDGLITPSISVLSAVEGLSVVSPSLTNLVLPFSVGILAALFAIQRFGTGVVGRLFGPVMAVWFTTLAVAGIAQIAKDPHVLLALSPTYGVAFFLHHPGVSFLALASIVLVVTGAEALYADLGHFGRAPIRLAWFVMVFPALTLTYLGEGSRILSDKPAIDNPFFALIPDVLRVPMVVVATVATVIASQALISGAYSISRQAVQLGFLPRLTIRHTSRREEGQIYVPAVNWTVGAGVLAVVLGFGSSSKLASAYGLAVTGTFVSTTVLFLVVARVAWKTPRWKIILATGVFLTIDVAYFAANLTKVPSGGWFPLVIASVVFTVLVTWRAGSRIVTDNRRSKEGPLRAFVEEVRTMHPPVHRVPGTAVFLHASTETTPLAMRANVEHNHVLQESVVILTVDAQRVAHIPVADQLVVDELGYTDDGIAHLTARLGYRDRPDIPRVVRLAADRGLELPIDAEGATYFVSRVTVARSQDPGLARWRKQLFLLLMRASADPVVYFGLPRERTFVISREIAL